MVFWWWLSSGRPMHLHEVLLVAAFVAAVAGAMFLTLSSMRSDWRDATAQVLSVEKVCALRSSNGYRQRSTEIVVPCGMTEQFREANPSRSWTLRQYHRGRVQITGDMPRVVVEAGLTRAFGSNPRVGDQVTVLQDPDEPTSFMGLDGPLQLTLPGYFLMGLGGFFAFIAFMWF